MNWEYAVRDWMPEPSGDPNQQKHMLDEMGAAGWECISVLIDRRTGLSYYTFYFKRPAKGLSEMQRAQARMYGEIE